MALMPMIGRVRLLRQWGGIMDMSMDGSPIIDRTPVDGLYLNAGWCYGGFKATPASGLVFAHLLARDEPHKEAERFRLDRFRRGADDRRKGPGRPTEPALRTGKTCALPVPSAARANRRVLLSRRRHAEAAGGRRRRGRRLRLRLSARQYRRRDGGALVSWRRLPRLAEGRPQHADARDQFGRAAAPVRRWRHAAQAGAPRHPLPVKTERWRRNRHATVPSSAAIPATVRGACAVRAGVRSTAPTAAAIPRSTLRRQGLQRGLPGRHAGLGAGRQRRQAGRPLVQVPPAARHPDRRLRRAQRAGRAAQRRAARAQHQGDHRRAL